MPALPPALCLGSIKWKNSGELNSLRLTSRKILPHNHHPAPHWLGKPFPTQSCWEGLPEYWGDSAPQDRVEGVPNDG